MNKIFQFATAFLLLFSINSLAQNKSNEPTAQDNATKIHVGDKAPDFTVAMLNGDSYTLSKLKGKVVLVNFWATWCGPCMQEFQVIPDKIVKRFKGKDFVLLPISRGETPEAVSKKMNQLKTTTGSFPVGLDQSKAIYNKYASSYIPRNFLVDKTGKVVFTSVGYNIEEFNKMCDLIEELLGK